MIGARNFVKMDGGLIGELKWWLLPTEQKESKEPKFLSCFFLLPSSFFFVLVHGVVSSGKLSPFGVFVSSPSFLPPQNQKFSPHIPHPILKKKKKEAELCEFCEREREREGQR